MNDKKTFVTDKIIGAGFVLYFIVLAIERALGGTLGLFYGGSLSVFGEGGGNYFAIVSHLICLASLVAGIVLAIKPLTGIFSTLFTSKEAHYDYDGLIRASVFMLLSGMMHTGVNIGGLQFTAYGCLIAGLIAKTVQDYQTEKGFALIVSLIYLVCFSMTVPVVYAPIGDDLFSGVGIFFVILEWSSAIVLDLVFHYLMLGFFKNKALVSSNIVPPLLMGFLDLILIALSFVLDTPDIFVLVFVALSLVSFVILLIAYKPKDPEKKA